MATATEEPGQTEIRRENLQRDVAVTARLEGLNLGAGMAAVQKTVNGLGLPADIRVAYGGGYEEQQRSFQDLVFVLVLAVLLVFIVLLFEFGSFAAPVAILASALLSTSGVFLALLVTGTTFNISSFMGLIMVIGIVAKNGILLLDADQRFRARGDGGRRKHDSGGRAAAAAHHDDGAGHHGRHDSAGAGMGRGIADAATAGDRGDRRDTGVDGAIAGGDAGRTFLPGGSMAGAAGVAPPRHITLTSSLAARRAPAPLPHSGPVGMPARHYHLHGLL